MLKNQVTNPEKEATRRNLIISRLVCWDLRASKANNLVNINPTTKEIKYAGRIEDSYGILNQSLIKPPETN